MRTKKLESATAALAIVAALAATTTHAQQFPPPTTATEVAGPASGTAMTTLDGTSQPPAIEKVK